MMVSLYHKDMPKERFPATGGEEENLNDAEQGLGKDAEIRKLKAQLEVYGDLLANHDDKLHEQHARAETFRQKAEDAGIDERTGLFTPKKFKEEFEKLFTLEERRKSKKEQPQMMTITLVDIDKFKAINDEYGHDNGNIVLREVAEKLKKLVRAQDLIERYGGEELLLIQPEFPEEKALSRLNRKHYDLPSDRDEDRKNGYEAAQLNFMIEFDPLTSTGIPRVIDVTLSGGIFEVSFPENCPPNEAWAILEKGMKDADELLYTAKRTGRNKILMKKKGSAGKDLNAPLDGDEPVSPE
jgi:diguanylate cyclase (GGDEF)-like protein